MTTELEKKFFNTFGIEPIAEYCKHQCNNELDESACIGCKYIEKVEYPQITDKQYLELICVLNENTTLDETYYQGASTVKELKKLVLKDLIKTKENFDTKHQVQAIFNSDQ